MVKLIISEKAIAGKRIAEILSNNTEKTELVQGIPLFHFTFNDDEYLLIPLKGHIVDVDFPKRLNYWQGVDVRLLAKSEIIYYPTAVALAGLLKKHAVNASEVIIATDADREGEAIGVEALRFIKEGNPKVKIKRAYFSAITPKDMHQAFSALAEVDYNFADSADARREIDLMWGASLTRFLSLVSGRLGKQFLSSGRVQTPTLEIIVSREKERLAFKQEKFFIVSAEFEKGGEKFTAEHKKGRIADRLEAEQIIALKESKGIVSRVAKKEKVLKRPVPFNTTEFLRAASAIGFSASKAMEVAESLYMSGHTSYPRTDNQCFASTIDLKEILLELRKVNEFSAFAEKLLSLNQLNPSRGKETKDHPPIHPVAFASKDRLGGEKWRIYELICRRFLACLLDDALVEAMMAELMLGREPFIARGQRILKAGWKEAYPYSKLTEVILPDLKKGDEAKLLKLGMEEGLTQPPPHYSQGTLIALMDELNLGTKATRAEIISKLVQRQYVAGLKQMTPNKVAFAVIDCLEKHAPDLVKPSMTALLEKEMDEIAAGKKSKQEVVDESRKLLLEVLELLVKEKNAIGSALRESLKQDSVLGKCPRCGKDLLIRFGRSGKRFVGCSGYPSCTQTFPLPQKGFITPLDKPCPQCGYPLFGLSGRRFRLEICLNTDCPSKDEWKQKMKEKAEKAEKEKAEAGAAKEPALTGQEKAGGGSGKRKEAKAARS
ncbi:DNA topoisomerase I [archaeon]|nr:DNA topoisomerase I [archaeon]